MLMSPEFNEVSSFSFSFHSLQALKHKTRRREETKRVSHIKKRYIKFPYVLCIHIFKV